MSNRRKGRELALQALYQLEINGDASERALGGFWESFESSVEGKELALRLIHGVLDHKREIDELISDACEHWRLERLSRVDVNVIRIAVYELTTPPPLPVEIAINEAIEIARRFGTEESAAFVNGVLDQIASRLELKQAPAKSPEG
jgi:N utilization substance protein B